MPITRTNAVSHKKKKITAAVVKIENSKRMNANRTNRIAKQSNTIPKSEVVPISNPNIEIILIDDNAPVSNIPIAEAAILLNKTNSSSIDIAQISNEKGEFKWVELEIGEYTLQVVAETYKSQILHVKCDKDSKIDLLISLLK